MERWKYNNDKLTHLIIVYTNMTPAENRPEHQPSNINIWDKTKGRRERERERQTERETERERERQRERERETFDKLDMCATKCSVN
jgi:hypothetical protein